jgi:allantoinase
MSPSPDRVLRSRRVVLPGLVRPACVVVHQGRIAAIAPWDEPLRVTDELGELALLPGLVDTHVHVNEPGRTDWEGFTTATRAAAAGGITTLVDMPLNSVPATTSAAALREKVRAMPRQLHVDVGLWGGVVPGNAGELEALAAAGALGFKCFLSPSGVDEFAHVSQADLQVAAPVLARLGLPLLAHAEDPARLRALPSSTRRYADWLASRPPEAEASAIAMLARLAAAHGLRVHVVHVASAAAVAALREGARALRAAGVAGGLLSGETCPHYLVFAAEEIADGATAFKCAPPIRERRERDALRSALLEAQLDLVASDHSPCPPTLKDPEGGDFAKAWGGITSLEVALSATWSALAPLGATLEDVALWMSGAPAHLAGLRLHKGAIAAGQDADLVAFDPEATWTPEPAMLLQRHRLTPYTGRPLRGRVLTTWLRGEPAFAAGAILGEPAGRWLRRGAQAVDPAQAFA